MIVTSFIAAAFAVTIADTKLPVGPTCGEGDPYPFNYAMNCWVGETIEGALSKFLSVRQS